MMYNQYVTFYRTRGQTISTTSLLKLSVYQETVLHHLMCSKNCQWLMTKLKHAYQDLQKERLQEGGNKEFHYSISRMTLKTFSSVKKQAKSRTNSKEAVLKADHTQFGCMVLIATSRSLNMLEELKHPLGPSPWSLANSDGTLKKTNKAALASQLEIRVVTVGSISKPPANIIDGIGLIQKVWVKTTYFLNCQNNYLHLLTKLLMKELIWCLM